MASFKVSLKIDQGSTFTKSLVWKVGTPAVAVDLTGCTARAHIRAKLSDTAVLLELTTENGRITLGGVTGAIDLLIDATTTAGLTWSSAVYDMEIIMADGITVRRLTSGGVSVSPEVTRG